MEVDFFSCKTGQNIPRVHIKVFFIELVYFHFSEFLLMCIKFHTLEDLTKYLMQEHSQLRTKSEFMICGLCYVRVESERELKSEQNL